MTDKEQETLPDDSVVEDTEAYGRRDFLVSLGKWSKAVIGGVVLGGLMVPGHEAKAVGWSNHGNWVNLGGGWPGYGGGGWGNRGGWWNRGGWCRPGWCNRRRPGWWNRGWGNRGWGNRGWYNR